VVQRESVEAVFDRHDGAMRQIWSEMQPRYDSVRAQIRSEIDAVLTEEQIQELRRLEAQRDSVRRHREDRGENDRN
jgi:hypothetical protein